MTDIAAFGTHGVWRGAAQLDGAFAQRVEQLGFPTLWVGGSPSADLMIVEEVLDATRTLVVATGIVNIWKDDAASVARSFRRIEDAHPGRFVVGIGSGHREATPERVHPLAALGSYLDVLDAEGVAKHQRLLAALGDKTLALAAERTLGAHPYLTLPGHTRHARGILGTALLAPELKFALAGTADEARETGRRYLRRYFSMSNYVAALRRFGATEADFADGGSDALIDQVVAGPEVADVVAGIGSHLAAGADHVAIQPIGADPLGDLERVAAVVARAA